MNITKGTIAYLSSDKLTKRIVRELIGREVYTSNDTTFVERIFEGGVFEEILGEVCENDTFNPMDEESIAKLEKLAELVDTDYVLVSFLYE